MKITKKNAIVENEGEDIIARKFFVTLKKLYPRGYSILNDGNFVKKIYAASDEDAIRQFNELATEGKLLSECIIKEAVGDPIDAKELVYKGYKIAVNKTGNLDEDKPGEYCFELDGEKTCCDYIEDCKKVINAEVANKGDGLRVWNKLYINEKLDENLNESSSFDDDVKDSYDALISSGKVEHPTIEDIFIDMSNPDNYNGIYVDWDLNSDPQVYNNARAAIVGAIGRLGIDLDESLNESKQSKNIVESVMSELDTEVKDAGGKEAWIAKVDEEIVDLQHYLHYLNNHAFNEINRGGNFDSEAEVEEAIANTEKEINDLKAKRAIINESKEITEEVKEESETETVITEEVNYKDNYRDLIANSGLNKDLLNDLALDHFGKHDWRDLNNSDMKDFYESVLLDNYLNESLNEEKVRSFFTDGETVLCMDYYDKVCTKMPIENIKNPTADNVSTEVLNKLYNSCIKGGWQDNWYGEYHEELKEDLDVEVDGEEVIPETKDEENVEGALINISIEQIISDLIKDEFEAVDGYNSAIATLKNLNEYEAVQAVLEDIKNEELVHVGELQKCLTEINPDANQIKDGEEEADETIAVASEEIAKGEEPIANENN